MEQKNECAARMRRHKHFHSSHVKVKRLAITCIVGVVGASVDLVFNNTVEFGELPASIDQLLTEPVVQSAARMLKVAMDKSLRIVQLQQKPPAFVLELLVLNTHTKLSAEPRSSDGVLLADGAMQLFVDSLQALVDDVDDDKTILTKQQRRWLFSQVYFPAALSPTQTTLIT